MKYGSPLRPLPRKRRGGEDPVAIDHYQPLTPGIPGLIGHREMATGLLNKHTTTIISCHQILYHFWYGYRTIYRSDATGCWRALCARGQ